MPLLDAFLFLLRVLPIIFASLLLAELLVRKGLLKLIPLKPVMKISHLGRESSSALLVAFISPLASSSMLKDFYDRGLVSKKELFIAFLARYFPMIIVEGRSMLPTLLPILGTAGLLYYGTWLLISLAISVPAIITGFFILPKRGGHINFEDDEKGWGEALKESLKSSIKSFKKIAITLVPLTFIAFILSDLGILRLLSQKLLPLSKYLPQEGLPLIATYIISPVASYPLAERLLSEGLINTSEMIALFLMGSILSLPVNLKFFIPYYIGIFGTRLGTELMTLSISLRVLITAGIIFLLLKNPFL